MTTNEIQLIRSNGDLLERRIYADESPFCATFFTYAEIWTRHVLPNRSPSAPMLEAGPWSDFARCHYTSLVRCWSAYGAAQNIKTLCRDRPNTMASSADRLLGLNAILASLFLSLASAIELLQKAGRVAPNSTLVQHWLRPANSPLDHICLLRNRFAHSWLVPLLPSAGTFVVDSIQIDASIPDQPWTTYGTAVDLVGLVDQLWHDFHHHMSAGWQLLATELRTHHRPGTPPAVTALGLSGMPGCALPLHSVPTAGPGSPPASGSVGV